jgi:tetratricopeptide (TPR) repeat protein
MKTNITSAGGQEAAHGLSDSQPQLPCPPSGEADSSNFDELRDLEGPYIPYYEPDKDSVTMESIYGTVAYLMERAMELCERETPEDLSQAVAVCRLAVGVWEARPSLPSDFRQHELAGALLEFGNALAFEPCQDFLPEAIEAFDYAIQLWKDLPMDEQPAYRSALAEAWAGRAYALAVQNTPNSLRQALRAFDRAVYFQESLLTADDPKCPYEVAELCISRARVLIGLGGEENLTEAVHGCDYALTLRAPEADSQLGLECGELARAWETRGYALGRMNTAESLAEAIHSYNQAIQLRETLPLAWHHTYRYALGWPREQKASITACQVRRLRLSS